LGAQVDRMGRPAVNTALNHTFDTTQATKDAAKDEYNSNASPATWTKYAAEFEKNMAILDSLDSICGNQSFYDGAKVGPARYETLAGVLADDRLWVDTSKATCMTYLAVELNATGAFVNTDCGGRKPSYSPVTATYGVLAAGSLDPAAVPDGTTQVDAKTKGTTFPYLQAPQ
jgi:hypothetical protein